MSLSAALKLAFRTWASNAILLRKTTHVQKKMIQLQDNDKVQDTLHPNFSQPILHPTLEKFIFIHIHNPSMSH
jgi:hypothetical protein